MADLPMVDDGRRRVLIYNPSCESAVSVATTILDPPSLVDDGRRRVLGTNPSCESAVSVATTTLDLPTSDIVEEVALDIVEEVASSEIVEEVASDIVDLEHQEEGAHQPILPLAEELPQHLGGLPPLESSQHRGGLSPDNAVAGTQMMNGSASDMWMSESVEREPLFEVVEHEPLFEGQPTPLTMSPLQWISRSTDGIGMSGGLLVAQAFHRAIIPAPTPMMVISFAGGESIDTLARQGVAASRHVIQDVCRNGRSFYVGITENPQRRWEEHVRESSQSWDYMEILIQAPSAAVTSPVERMLIDEWGGWAGQFLCHNVGGGGERASGGMPHYVYLLVGPPVLRRNGTSR